jgi:hypothetical protein
MYVYGKKFIEFKKEIKIEIDSGRIIFKPEFQSTIEIFFADKLPNELIRQFENLIKNFTNYFQKTEN